MMGPIGEVLRETFFPLLFVGEEVDANFQKILSHSFKCGVLDSLDPGHQHRERTTPPSYTSGNW